VHKLEMEDLVAEISPRLIVGRNVYRTKRKEMRELVARVETSLAPLPALSGERVAEGRPHPPLRGTLSRTREREEES
jgi:hypothetical protein